jgi:hypothetical protein
MHLRARGRHHGYALVTRTEEGNGRELRALCLFRHLASAPKVCWRARAGAPALEQEPKLLLSSLLPPVSGGPLSRKHAHALREEVTRVVAAAHEAYPEAAAMLSLHLGLHRRATLSPLPSRTPTQLPADIEDPDHLFDSTVM